MVVRDIKLRLRLPKNVYYYISYFDKQDEM